MQNNSPSGSTEEIIKDKDGHALFFEEVIETFAGHVMVSECRPATQEEIDEAARRYKDGKCPHVVFYDEPGWLYDARRCHTCGGGMGTV